jgi:uncharacterized protein DUF1097
MKLITALAIVIGLLGGLATYAFLADHTGFGLQIWAAFIAWGSFYHCGGKVSGLQSSLLGNIWGIVMAALTLAVFNGAGLAESLTAPVWAGICVAIGVMVMILAANIPFLSAIPAAVYGFAATAAFALLTSNGLEMLLMPTEQNPAVVVAISMIIGGILGYISEAIAGSLAKS